MSGACLRTSMPRMVALPEVRGMRPQRARMMVVLPEPLGPRKPKSSPRSRSKLTSSDGGEVAEADGEVVGGDDVAASARAHCRVTVADMPDLRTLLGLSTWTLTPKTSCSRSSRVWTLRGRNSAEESISWMRPVNWRPPRESTVTLADWPMRMWLRSVSGT